VVGYNVQSAVDTQNHIIVAHEVSNGGIDKGHLSSMAARDALDAETIEVLADRGSFKSEELGVRGSQDGNLCSETADIECASGGSLRSLRSWNVVGLHRHCCGFYPLAPLYRN
jgi:hypothetical protein